MPELPEVETIRRDLLAHILNKGIKEVLVKDRKIVKNPAPFFIKTLEGGAFKDILRRGKLLALELKGGKVWLLVHLKMTGQLIYVSPKKKIYGGHEEVNFSEEQSLPNKFSRVIIYFKDKSVLFFNDIRRFGYLKLVDKAGLDEAWAKFGPEPLEKSFSLDYFKTILKRQKNLKALLLDQGLIAGLGNIYVDEALFRAGLKPTRRAKSLKKEEVLRLYEAVKEVLREAIKHRGTTFSDYRDGRGGKGNFVPYLRVYGRGGEKCLKCSFLLKKAKVAGRGSVYCPHCQA